MAKTDSSLVFDPSLTDVDAYLQMVRNKRMADALNLQANGPMDYDPKGFISPAQILAKGLAGIASKPANDAVDKDQINQIMAQQRQQQQMFGIGPQALAQGLQGQSQPNQPITTPTNALGRGFDSAQQALYMSQHNPELYKEIVGKNLELTNDQKNFTPDQLQQFNLAQIAAKKAEGVKGYQGGETVIDQNTGMTTIAPKLLDIQAGDRHVLGNQTPSGFAQTGSVASGITPNQAFKVNLQTGSKWSPEELDYWTKEAQRIGNTDFAKGASKQNRDALLGNIAKLQVLGGAQPGDFTNAGYGSAADKRTMTELGAREGKIAARVQEARNMIPLALDASSKVDRSRYVPLNKISQWGQSQLESNPDLAALKASTQSFLNAYTAAINNGARTVHDAQEASTMLYTAQNKEVYERVLRQLDKEMESALAAPQQVKDRLIHGGNPSEPTTSNAPALTPKDQAALAWAQANPNDPRAAAIMQHLGGR
jgi:hypothetical protein